MLKTYTGGNIVPLGVLKTNVEYKDQQPLLLDLYVVKNKGPVLMGRDWLYKIRLDWYAIKSLKASQTPPIAKERLQTMLDKYSDVFEDKLGTLKSAKAKLTLKEESQAHFCKARAVPYALRPKVEEELRRLQNEGILTKVEWSDWATPIVPVPKKDGLLAIIPVVLGKKVTHSTGPVKTRSQRPDKQPSDRPVIRQGWFCNTAFFHWPESNSTKLQWKLKVGTRYCAYTTRTPVF